MRSLISTFIRVLVKLGFCFDVCVNYTDKSSETSVVFKKADRE